MVWSPPAPSSGRVSVAAALIAAALVYGASTSAQGVAPHPGEPDAAEGSGEVEPDAAEGSGDAEPDAAEGSGEVEPDAAEGSGDAEPDAAEGSGDAEPDAAEGSGEVGDLPADEEAPDTGDPAGGDWDEWETGDAPDYRSRSTADGAPPHEGRAASRVAQEDMDVRLPRSAPDALRYEPGVYVQQTAQSQGSPYIRGRTGQQTVLLFDGVRLNNSLFRQGPNQYFFTIDSRSIDHIDVLRGSASTRYGTDAIAGAIDAHPTAPERDPKLAGFGIRPRLYTRYDSASDEYGGRAQVDLQTSPRLGVFGGIGYRTVDLLRSGGPVYSPTRGELPEVPRFDEDGVTQLGTGFDEVTGDVRIAYELTPDLDLVVAAYNYRQTDAPRTDQCAPPFAPANECLTYDEQFRTVAFAGLDGGFGDAVRDMQLRLSWQRQHERRTHERPDSFTVNGGRDDVDTVGIRFVAATRPFDLGPNAVFVQSYGADLYHDRVASKAWLIFTDVDIVRHRTRGQYLDDSRYTWGGAFTESELRFWERLTLRGGGRIAYVDAFAPPDPESDTAAVDRTWSTGVGSVGMEFAAHEYVTVLANIDQGFRAPNLDDMTSRQRTGPGYQLENAELDPERGLTIEGGVQLRHDVVQLDAWAYRMTLRDAISRATRQGDDCPAGEPACRNAWSILQLVNAPGTSVIRGAEASLLLHLPERIDLRGTVSWARGDQPNPNAESVNEADRAPVSRIPPLNGTVEALWRSWFGFYAGAGLRWATLQDRLAISDVSDERIPRGGTPGFVVADLRAGYLFDPWVTASLVFDNLTDTAYRYHGSSVNGPGRSVILNLELGLRHPRGADD